MTEPWKIPPDWRWSTMGEVAEVVGGGTPRTERADYYGGEIPWITPADLSGYCDKLIGRGSRSITKAGLDNSGARLLPTGTVLFSSRAPIGYVAIAANPLATNQGFKSFVLRDGVAPDYVYYYLQHAKKLALELASGTTFLEISGKKAARIPIPIPTIDQQHKIVAEIERQFTRLEAGVAGLRRVQANLKRYRAAVLKAACEGKLVPTEACLRQAERGRQAELARQEGRALPAPRPGVFFVYAIRCDNDSIYIGQTQDLQKRWKEHLAGQATDWTSQHKPLLIVHHEEYSSREEAVAREKWLKTGFGRKWIRREIAAGRLPAEQAGARQAGYETGAQLLERILTERRQKWNGKGKYKEPAKPDTANLPSLPEGWIWATVEQVSSWLAGSIQSGPFGSQLLHSEFVSEGVLAIGIDNVLDGRFSVGSNHRIRPEKYSALRKFTARPDDVVVTVMATVGRVCVLPEHLGPAIITKHCYRITPATIGIAPHFLALTLRADAPTRSHIFGNIRGQTRPGINGPILKVAPIPVPPLIEQQRILGEVERRLSVIEELEAVVNTNLQRATRIRQAMLHQAFSGNLVLEGK